MSLHTPTIPKIYSVDNLPNFWIAEGTDGCLYKVPSQPGGWLQGDRYSGQKSELKPVAPEKARAILWLTYGDMGSVRIAEG
jgi:hypothetical protein